MTKPVPKRVSVNTALSAFRYTVCELMCGKEKKHINKCIVEEGGCKSYKVFNYKISK